MMHRVSVATLVRVIITGSLYLVESETSLIPP